MSEMSMSIFGPCQMVLDKTKYQGPFGMDQMSYGHLRQDKMFLQVSRTSWCGPKFLWTRCLMDQISYERFGQNQISKTFWCETNVLWMFWTGPNVLQGHTQNSSFSNYFTTCCYYLCSWGYLSIVSVWWEHYRVRSYCWKASLPNSMFSDDMLVAWNWLWWGYLCHRNK